MLLPEERIKDALSNFRGWELTDSRIVKTYRMMDFMKAVEVLNKVAVLAEHAQHHPDISIQNYNQLVVSIHSHSEGGVTEKDINLAKEIETLIALEI